MIEECQSRLYVQCLTATSRPSITYSSHAHLPNNVGVTLELLEVAIRVDELGWTETNLT